ncbi:MAG: cupin domain-containing protein [Solirubrobacteraceae bacterium]
MQATWSSAGEGRQVWFLGTLQTVRVPGETVAGRYSLVEALLPHHASPPLHTHPQDESFIVLDGRLTVVAGAERFELEVGGIMTVPMGVEHTFRVDSDSARVLVLSTPAGIEQLFLEGGVPATASTLPPPDTPRPSAEEIAEIFNKHHVLNVGPPLGADD